MLKEININQKELSKSKLNVADASILNYLCEACDEKEYVHIDYTTLLKEMPLLRIKSIGALSRRLNKIEKEKFIETKRNKLGEKLIRLTNKTKKL